MEKTYTPSQQFFIDKYQAVVGTQIGKLSILKLKIFREPSKTGKGNSYLKYHFLIECFCGVEFSEKTSKILHKITRSCGCKKPI